MNLWEWIKNGKEAMMTTEPFSNDVFFAIALR